MFLKGDYDLGSTDIVTHSIDTGDNKPIRQPLRRHTLPHLQAIREQTMKLLKQDIIELTVRMWTSNVVLVKKKDGSLRFCIHYRRLNEASGKDLYPLPRIDSCLVVMAGAKLFSTFDHRAGYHQVKMDPVIAEKQRYHPRRHLIFKAMPYGLTGAPATLQRLMDLAMAGLNLEICLVYLDDINVFSTEVPEHLQRLRAIFERLRSARLKLKPYKCKLFQISVSFLGHVISGQGIATDPAKVENVVTWPVLPVSAM